jgi:hypothetical protein
MMRPFALEIVVGNFDFAAGDRRIVRLDLAQAFLDRHIGLTKTPRSPDHHPRLG